MMGARGDTPDLRRSFCRSAVVVALTFALLAVFAVQAHAALYIGEAAISRANLDGSALEERFIATNGPCAIAADSSYIYWDDSYNNVIGRARLDGSSVEYDFIKLAPWTLPCGLALDSYFIYWPNMGTDTIGRARLDGSEVDESFIPTVPHPCAVAVNGTGIYWASDSEDGIWRTDIAGTNKPEAVITEKADDPCGIALQGQHLFWVESLTGAIGRANLDGSDAVPAFVTGGHYPVSVTIQDGHLYWINNESGSVGRADLNGANVNQEFIGGLNHPYALAADGIQVTPRHPAVFPPAQASTLPVLGKLRRFRNGSLLFPMHVSGQGTLEASAGGMSVKIQPGGLEGPVTLAPGLKWLKISLATTPRPGSRCVLRAFNQGKRVKIVLRMVFTEPGKTSTAMRRWMFLYRPLGDSAGTSRRKGPPVNCVGI